MFTRSLFSRTAVTLSLGGVLILTACTSVASVTTTTATAAPSNKPATAESAIGIPGEWRTVDQLRQGHMGFHSQAVCSR